MRASWAYQFTFDNESDVAVAMCLHRVEGRDLDPNRPLQLVPTLALETQSHNDGASPLRLRMPWFQKEVSQFLNGNDRLGMVW